MAEDGQRYHVIPDGASPESGYFYVIDRESMEGVAAVCRSRREADDRAYDLNRIANTLGDAEMKERRPSWPEQRP